MTSFSIVNKNANRLLGMGSLLVFVVCMAYVVNTLFVNPGKNVDFSIFAGAGFFDLLPLFVPLVLLTLLNLAVEAYKWWALTGSIELVSYRRALGSILTGLALGFITPNRLGDFPGRAILFSPGNRTKVVLMNLLAGYSQFVVICLLGLVSLYCLPLQWSWFLYGNATLRTTWIVLLVLLLLFHLLVMFNTRSFLAFFARFRWLKNMTQRLEGFPSPTVPDNIFALKLSLLRSVIYTAQLIWLLHFMEPGVPLLKWALYANLYFFVLTVAPSFMLNKLGVRESLAALVFYDVCANPVVPVVSVLLLWIANQVLPAVAGACILFKKTRA